MKIYLKPDLLLGRQIGLFRNVKMLILESFTGSMQESVGFVKTYIWQYNPWLMFCKPMKIGKPIVDT